MRVVAIAALTFAVGLSLHAQEQCAAGRDLVARALERLNPGMPADQLEDPLQLLKTATGECVSLGDAWYYRSIVERHLGHDRLADYSAGKAKFYGSDALAQNVDPFTLAAPPGEVSSQLVREKWALIIGISRFHDPRLNLAYPSKDAKDLRSVLVDTKWGRFRDDHVHIVTDADATTVRIKTELNWIARMAKPDDLAVIYISSHGSPREKDIAEANYVYTYDTNTGDKFDGLYATALPMIELVNVVRNRMKARRAVVLMDTCHSGGVLAGGVSGASASDQTLAQFREGIGRAIITSSQVKERSYESDSLQNGYFTHYLIEALKKDDGRLPVEKVYSFLKDQVSKSVMQAMKLTQTPVMSASEHGRDIVIGADPAATNARDTHADRPVWASLVSFVPPNSRPRSR